MTETISTRSRISVYLAGEFFTSRQVVLARAADILRRYEPGLELKGEDYRFIRELIDKHPRAPFVVGCGIQAITAYQPPRRRGRVPDKSLRIIRLDGTVALCGFKDVLLGRVHNREEFVKAAREAVKFQIELFSRSAFKSSLSQIWCHDQKTWITYRNHEVKYLGKSFEELIDSYVAIKQLHLAGIRYFRSDQHEGAVFFADPDDKREWQNWHRQHAQLRIVKKYKDLREVSA